MVRSGEEVASWKNMMRGLESASVATSLYPRGRDDMDDTCCDECQVGLSFEGCRLAALETERGRHHLLVLCPRCLDEIRAMCYEEEQEGME